jgi:hypothetical protein
MKFIFSEETAADEYVTGLNLTGGMAFENFAFPSKEILKHIFPE